MNIKNDFVKIEIGNNKYEFNNLILDELLRRYIKCQTEVGSVFDIKNRPYLIRLQIKFDEPIDDICKDKVLKDSDFDIGIVFGQSNIIKYGTRQITVEYQYKCFGNDKVLDYNTGEYADLSEFRGRKIATLGFNSVSIKNLEIEQAAPICAILDTSNYNIYLEGKQDFVVTRRDTITTDAEFYTNNPKGIMYPLHLGPKAGLSIIDDSEEGTQGILYSVGLSSYKERIDKEFVIGEDLVLTTTPDEITISGLECYLETNPLFPDNNLYPSSDLYPTATTYKYIIFKYKVYQKVSDNYKDTGSYYYQIVPIYKYGKLKLKIRYERG